MIKYRRYSFEDLKPLVGRVVSTKQGNKYVTGRLSLEAVKGSIHLRVESRRFCEDAVIHVRNSRLIPVVVLG